jgi:hypothetical protein
MPIAAPWLIDEDKKRTLTKKPGSQQVNSKKFVMPRTATACRHRRPIRRTAFDFDVYDDPQAENAKKIDQQTGYRTCR